MSKNEDYEKGNEEFKNKNFIKAIEHYTKCISIEKNPVFYSNRSACYYNLYKPEKALEDALESIKIDASFMRGYQRAYNCYIFQKDYGKAMSIVGI
jgi:mitochondrial import receptor subunit TOM70